MVERVLSMDEAAGSMPATSINLLFPSAPPIKKKGTYFKRVCVCGEGGQGAGGRGRRESRAVWDMRAACVCTCGHVCACVRVLACSPAWCHRAMLYDADIRMNACTCVVRGLVHTRSMLHVIPFRSPMKIAQLEERQAEDPYIVHLL